MKTFKSALCSHDRSDAHRSLCFTLSLLTAVSVMASCGNQTQTAETTAVSDLQTASAEVSETQPPETIDSAWTDDLDASYDFGGRDFHFLLYGNGDPYAWSEVDVLAEEQTGETINDGIYQRNLKVEERLNIHFTGEFDLNAAPLITKAVQGGDDTYDAAWLQIQLSGAPAQNGSLLDWKNLPHVDLQKAYWDASIIRDLSIGGKIYYLTGDISTIDNQATWTLMFNKTMLEENDIPSPYEMVDNGTWTMDRFSAMTKDVAADINGDGVFTFDDKYGLSTTPDTVYGLFYSSGLTFISKNEDDMPYFNLDMEKAKTVLEKTAVLLNEGNRTLLSTRTAGAPEGPITCIRNAFFENRALFYAEVMFHVANLRQMETDFGIIPLPKYDEAQKDYITFVNPAASALTIPTTNQNLEETGIILEAMASASHEYLTPAYYETALKGKYARDDESARMLDLLLQNRVYDLALIYGWGNVNSGYVRLAEKNSTDLASMIAKKESKITTSIEKFIDSFENQNA